MPYHRAEPLPDDERDAGQPSQLFGVAAAPGPPRAYPESPARPARAARSPARSPVDAYNLLFSTINTATYAAVPPASAVDQQNTIACEYLENITRTLFQGKVDRNEAAVRHILWTHFSTVVNINIAMWEPFKETREAYISRLRQFWEENEDFHGELDSIDATIDHDKGGKAAFVFINWTARGIGIMEEDRKSRRESVMRVDYELHDGRWVGHGWSFLLGPGHSSFVGGLVDIPRNYT